MGIQQATPQSTHCEICRTRKAKPAYNVLAVLSSSYCIIEEPVLAKDLVIQGGDYGIRQELF